MGFARRSGEVVSGSCSTRDILKIRMRRMCREDETTKKAYRTRESNEWRKGDQCHVNKKHGPTEPKPSSSLSPRWTEPTSNSHGPSSDSAIGDPINITSPSPSSSLSSSSSISRHRSTRGRPLPFSRNASRDREGVNRCLLPAPVDRVLPNVAWDNRLSITELARLTSDRRGVAGGTRGSPIVVVRRAPADPGRAAPTPTMLTLDDESLGPRMWKWLSACVGSDTGELFDSGEPVPPPVPALETDPENDPGPESWPLAAPPCMWTSMGESVAESERFELVRLMTRLLRRVFFGVRPVSEENICNEWVRSRPFRRVLLPPSVSSQIDGTRVGCRPAE